MKTLKNRLISIISGLIICSAGKSTNAFSQSSVENTIIVHNQNDSRLIAYEDSLNSYNNYRIIERILENLSENKFLNANELNNYIDSLIDTYPFNASLRIQEKNLKIIKNFYLTDDEKLSIKRIAHYDFKYPVQKVVYEPAEKIIAKSKQKTELEIDKTGLFTMHDGRKYTYDQLIDIFSKMKNDLVFKANFPGREKF